MAITRPKPKNTQEATDAFISGAPDAEARPRGVKKGQQAADQSDHCAGIACESG